MANEVNRKSAAPRRGPNQKLSQVQIVSLAVGIVLLLFVLSVVILYPCPTDSQRSIFKIVLAIAVAGLAAVIPGFFQMRFKKIISAGGAIAVFAFIFLYNPAVYGVGGSCDYTFILKVYNDSAHSELASLVPLHISIDTRNFNASTNQSGELTLILSQNDRGKEMSIQQQGEEYVKEEIRLTIPDKDATAAINLRRPIYETTVRGRIQGSAKTDYSKMALAVDGHEIRLSPSGEFETKVPLKEGTVVLFEILENNKVIKSQHAQVTSARIILTP